ncbi:N-acetylmuramoyl-L-alanine amidase [Formosa agariphila KMM 3901]|uniref:N-acetylmuramoyl-L-alanine amidase n=1 Tax=Formosa agariphila (strain DSM 15362 / KCTC 12365 / LMG 23005 / KMM 3901 / M-2Alg 35-1) TaxID=1347342 RepID=T2KN49_FORAG|nr:N-acetylmuramoyl-L-alanine amidase [Formosa agariphila]CDF79414.1 N-acetylmuramoyl-L-alanine amidase [Formosa agariphila KMM 3901]
MKSKPILIYFSFISIILLTSFTNDKPLSTSKFVVVLDAGHGGHDPGKPTKFGFTEKEVALKIVLKIGAELEKNKDIKVIYTRKTDVFVTLRGRAKIANEADADLFVSVHCNAHHSQASGTETYVVGVANTKRNFDVAKLENEVILLEDDYETHYDGFNPNAPESLIGLTLMQEDYIDYSIMLAGMIENNFANKLKRKSRGVKQASLWVMHNTYMPSVLIETGFITNTEEGRYLNSNKGQTEISSAIKDAILEYKTSLDLNVGENLGTARVQAIITDEEDDLEDETNNPDVYADVEFKIQIAASSKKLETKPFNFNGLSPVSRDQVGKIYKYYYGATSNYSEVQSLLLQAKAKGFDTSFIVAFRDGAQIHLDKVLKTTSN